jgi:hypothetical protein
MIRHVEVEELAAVMTEHDEGEEKAVGEGGNEKEVDGDDVSSMGGEEGTPRGRRVSRRPVHVLGDSQLGDLVAEPGELAGSLSHGLAEGKDGGSSSCALQVSTSWGAPAQAPFAGLVVEALSVQLPDDRSDLLKPFSLSDPQALAALYEAAGFADVVVELETGPRLSRRSTMTSGSRSRQAVVGWDRPTSACRLRLAARSVSTS